MFTWRVVDDAWLHLPSEDWTVLVRSPQTGNLASITGHLSWGAFPSFFSSCGFQGIIYLISGIRYLKVSRYLSRYLIRCKSLSSLEIIFPPREWRYCLCIHRRFMFYLGVGRELSQHHRTLSSKWGGASCWTLCNLFFIYFYENDIYVFAKLAAILNWCKLINNYYSMKTIGSIRLSSLWKLK